MMRRVVVATSPAYAPPRATPRDDSIASLYHGPWRAAPLRPQPSVQGRCARCLRRPRRVLCALCSSLGFLSSCSRSGCGSCSSCSSLPSCSRAFCPCPGAFVRARVIASYVSVSYFGWASSPEYRSAGLRGSPEYRSTAALRCPEYRSPSRTEELPTCSVWCDSGASCGVTVIRFDEEEAVHADKHPFCRMQQHGPGAAGGRRFARCDFVACLRRACASRVATSSRATSSRVLFSCVAPVSRRWITLFTSPMCRFCCVVFCG